MGLDISVIRTPKSIDLEELYAIMEAVGRGFPWYLGDDKKKRAEKWVELKNKCKSLTRADVLANTSEPPDLVKCLNQISEVDFNTYLAWVVGSISNHEDGNTHLNFDYDKLPGKTIFDSCSWNLHDLFKGCEKDNRPLKPCGEFIREIDPYKVWIMSERWNGKRFELGLAKWIGYFSQRVGFNIMSSCLKDLNVQDAFVDQRDVRHYQECIGKVVKDARACEDRLWLVASY